MRISGRLHWLTAVLLFSIVGRVPVRAEMDIAQTLSDQAQGMTIAFDGLAFLTGSLGADSFLPPGKVADFSGFQYLRDNDPTQMGHNTDFVTIIARNVLNILTPAQITQMVQRAETQIDMINLYGEMRFPLMQAFRRQLTNAIPADSEGLEWAAVKQQSSDLYYVDGLISLDRAQLFGEILRNMTASQKSNLNNLATLGGVGNWNQTLPDPLQGLHLSPDISVGVMTYASEMYSWYAGSVEADTYFCPERQGTYFGSFYLKDAPAMGNTNYTIDSNLTADRGNEFLALLTPAQRFLVTNLVVVQKPYLYELVDVRSNISVHLRQLMVTNVIDTNAVLALCRRYGELDGMIVYNYASHFSQVGQSLTTNQQAQIMAVRVDMLGEELLYPDGAYLYSSPIPVPDIPNTDSLFVYSPTNCMPAVDTGQTSGYSAVFGEDADYLIDPPAFSNGTGVAYDNVTGRMWQQTDGGEMTWEAAVAYASSLSLGGYNDWRLPTAHELFSIVNHGRFGPAMDTSVFASSGAGYWWTQDTQNGNTDNVWVVNSGGGIGPHPKSETVSAGGDKLFHVRCVRGTPPPLDVRMRHNFLNNADGTITDLDTGLTWQQGEASSATWTSALHYADSLNLGGNTDWRLPNIKELQSLNDESTSAPSLDRTFFPGAQSSEYWSSTTMINDTNTAWTLNFQLGIASYNSKTSLLPVRCVRGGMPDSIVASGASPVPLASGFGFTEGPAADTAGNVYFTDVTANTIYCWSLGRELSIFRTGSGGANGLAFDLSGNLVACEGNTGRITSTDLATNVTVLVDAYGGLRFNEPNDLWVDHHGGVYFTDPVYMGHSVVQGGEHVYYLPAGSTTAVRVTTDLVKPNGLAGTPDGSTLYIADYGASIVYRYGISSDGSLTGKASFASVRCDGMTIDAAGRLYLCESAVRVFNSAGNEIAQITIPGRPTNVEFGGNQRQYLFITSEAGTLYAVRMSSQGAILSAASNTPPVISEISRNPGLPGSNDIVCITAYVLDDSAVESVTLAWAVGPMQNGTNTVFTETMGANSSKPWNGAGSDHAWTVDWNGTNPFEQRSGANYGSGNTNGLEFKAGTTNLTDSMITVSKAINAAGSSGWIEFAVWADGLTSNMGWALQLNSGNGFLTRSSELIGTNHAWKTYRYDLQPGELVSNLYLRFQFRGGSGDPRICLDSISVKTVSAGNTSILAMFDDGMHCDAVARDGIYGAFIPTNPAGRAIHYYFLAVDDDGAETLYPETSPAGSLTYTVAAAVADSVGDGIPDWWRARYFGGNGTTTNSVSGAYCDPDGDGAGNLEEYLSDTNPTNSLSVFEIIDVPASIPFTVSFLSSPNRKYTMYFSTNLISGVWTNISSQTGVRGSGGVDEMSDPEFVDVSRFYKIGVLLP